MRSTVRRLPVAAVYLTGIALVVTGCAAQAPNVPDTYAHLFDQMTSTMCPEGHSTPENTGITLAQGERADYTVTCTNLIQTRDYAGLAPYAGRVEEQLRKFGVLVESYGYADANMDPGITYKISVNGQPFDVWVGYHTRTGYRPAVTFSAWSPLLEQ